MHYKKTDKHTLEKAIDEIFEEQNKHYFETPLEKNAEDITIGAYDGKKLIGGIIARKEYQNIHVSMLAVKDDYRSRNVGSQLLIEVEKIARESDVINLTLTTKSYQAVEFYKKTGFTVYATLEDMPIKGVTKYYFNKRLTDL